MVDPSRVRAQEKVRDFEEWARYLRVQPERLREAVRAVGITPRKIRQYFREAPLDRPPDRLGSFGKDSSLVLHQNS